MTIRTNADVAAKVRGVAAERLVSQGELAAALNISRMSMSRRFSGQTAFAPAELIALALLFNVPVGTFFGETTADPSQAAA